MSESEADPEAAATTAVGAALPEHFFELYKLAVEMADRISSRRGTANGFFLTINTGLVALIGGTTLRWYVAVAGIVFSGTWWLLLKSYRRLNAAKFRVIVEMEAQLPKQIFGDEYRHYQASGKSAAEPAGAERRRRERLAAWAKRYRELGEVERVVPVVFALIYATELIRQIA